MVKENLPANAGDIRDTDSIPGSGRSPGGGHGNSLQEVNSFLFGRKFGFLGFFFCEDTGDQWRLLNREVNLR